MGQLGAGEARIRNLELEVMALRRDLDKLGTVARKALESAGAAPGVGNGNQGPIWAKVTTAIPAPTLSTSAIPTPGAAQIQVYNPGTNLMENVGSPVAVRNRWPGTTATPVGKVVTLMYDPQQGLYWLGIENCTNPG